MQTPSSLLLRLASLSLVTLFLVAALPTPVLAEDGPSTPVTGPLWRQDADGGITYQVQIEDPAGGTLRELDRVHFEPLPATPPEVTGFGYYQYTWPGDTDRITIGLYTDTESRGIERAPLVILENVTDIDLFLAGIQEEAALIAVSAGFNMGVIAGQYALPSSAVGELAGQTAGLPFWVEPTAPPFLLDTYRTLPTYYAWTAHKTVANTETWSGSYLLIEGDHGKNSDDTHAYAHRVIEIGHASRIDGTTTHIGGAYVQETLERTNTATTSTYTDKVTVGATTAATGRVPLASLKGDDHRDTQGEGTLQLYPGYQDTGFALGVETPNGFVPLIGTRTESTNDYRDADTTGDGNPDTAIIENTRTTSIGVYVLDEYTPIAGVRYHGERWPVDLWALQAVATGGIGSRIVGDWEVDTGIFVLGAFQPLIGVHYDDDFEDHHYTYRAMITQGVWVDDAYQPLLGTTYDGEAPQLDWTNNQLADGVDADTTWHVSEGTFVLDDYVPVLGLRYEPGSRTNEGRAASTYTVGVHPANYDTFVPLMHLWYDGDHFFAATLPMHAIDGVLGAHGDYAWSVGTEANGQSIPIAAVRYADSTPGSNANGQAEITLDAFILDERVPLAGLRIESDGHYTANGGETGGFTVTPVVYVDGSPTALPSASIPVPVVPFCTICMVPA